MVNCNFGVNKRWEKVLKNKSATNKANCKVNNIR